MDGVSMDNTQGDSTLSIISNVAGILTFVVAIIGAAYVRIAYLRNSDQEYFRVKTSLAWYKTESEWLARLVEAAGARADAHDQPEYQIYSYVRDDLLRLEKRILDLVDAAEEKAGTVDNHPEGKRWAMIPQSWRFTTAVTVAWLPIRAQTLELVRQREALTTRVSFTQTSMIASRIRDLERRSETREYEIRSGFESLEATIKDQKAEIYRLEDLLYRAMHRDRVNRRGVDTLVSHGAENVSEKPCREGLSGFSPLRQRALSR